MALDKKAQIRFIVGIFVILFGTLGALFLGLGIIFNNANATWLGGIIMSAVPFVLALIARLIR